MDFQNATYDHMSSLMHFLLFHFPLGAKFIKQVILDILLFHIQTTWMHLSSYQSV
jgi:hypothetical protein